MCQSGASKDTSLELFQEIQTDSHPPARHSNVLSWPEERKASSSSVPPMDLIKAESLIRKITLQQYDPVYLPVEPADAGSLSLRAHKSRKYGRSRSLAEEMPAAEQIYNAALKSLHNVFLLLACRKKLDVRSLEYTSERLIASLERNSDALLLLAQTKRRGIYMHSHSVNVGIFMAAFALGEGKSRSEAYVYGLGGLLHDVGMALLPLSLLSSREELSATEQVLVKRHPLIACEQLSGIPGLHPDVLLAALEHHEHCDGSGYPYGLSGASISSIGYLAAIAGAYDAMSSQRLHRAPLPPHRALGRLFQLREKQFHSFLLERFVRMVGVYPVGSVVELLDGYKGVVCANSPRSPMRPVVALVRDAKGRPMHPQICDLAVERAADIAACLSSGSTDINVWDALGVSL